jgi:hypothetical protein
VTPSWTNLYVEEGYRGRGVGGLALRLAADTCQTMDIRALHLEVDRENHRASTASGRSGSGALTILSLSVHQVSTTSGNLAESSAGFFDWHLRAPLRHPAGDHTDARNKGR